MNCKSRYKKSDRFISEENIKSDRTAIIPICYEIGVLHTH